MAVEKKKSVKLREEWANVFNALKSMAPGLFGSKVFADVKFIGSDPSDTSKLLIEFNEENEV